MNKVLNKVIENKKELILLAICSFIYISIFTILEKINLGKNNLGEV